MGSLCTEVYQSAVQRLGADFDVRAAWVSVANTAPTSDCHDWTMPLEGQIPVPVCDGIPPRWIDDGDGEEWGDATAVMTTPYDEYPIGANGEPWPEREAVLILIPISDEGPQNGDDDGPCTCVDGMSVSNLISQAQIENVQVLPMPTAGTPSCVYDPDVDGSYMSLVASQTTGSVVDAREWPWEVDSNALSANLEDAIRCAIRKSPRRTCSCPNDVSGDGVVNGMDIATMLSAWGFTGDCLVQDLNGDGIVGGADLTYLLSSWGACP